MSSITLGGLTFTASDFASATNPLGHTTVLPATVAGGHSYSAEVLFPDRLFGAMKNEIADRKAEWDAAVEDSEAAATQALAVAANAPSSTSTSSRTIAISGTLSFTLEDQLSAAPFQVGMYVQIASDASNANRMWGIISAITNNTAPTKDVITVDILDGDGSGTFADWTIIGNTGPKGEDGSGTPTINPGDSLKLLVVKADETDYILYTVAAYLALALPSLLDDQLTLTFDGGGEAVSAALVRFMRIPFNFTVQGWEIYAYDAAGNEVDCSCEFDVWMDTVANFPPTSADSIVSPGSPSGTPPAIPGGSPTVSTAQGSDLTGWITSLIKGRVLGGQLVSVSGTATVITLTLYGVRA